jgi:hypothetical protein
MPKNTVVSSQAINETPAIEIHNQKIPERLSLKLQNQNKRKGKILNVK